MSYIEYQPSGQLATVVDTIWIAKHSSKVSDSRILPDGYVDLIFDLDRLGQTTVGSAVRVAGMMTTARTVPHRANGETLGVRFKTGHFNALVNLPLSTLKNQAVALTDCTPKFDVSQLEALALTQQPDDKLKQLHQLLTAQLNFSALGQYRLERSVATTIKANFLNLDLSKIAEAHHISLRQLERRFKAAIGVTMKEYHHIVRFKRTLNYLAENPDTSLLHVAYDNGYFDHAHLTKTFNRMAGFNPSLA